MPFVLDSSAVLAMLLPDEQSAAVDRLAESLVRSPALVPSIWPLEVRNALLAALRAGRITSREFEDRVELVEALPVEVDGSGRTDVLAASVTIARRHGLSVYDASYLELARRAALPLATLDRRLRKAAASLKIRSLP